jgi:hypothetical protein
MELSRELRGDVISGDITVSFRLWRRPKVREGGRYPVGPGTSRSTRCFTGWSSTSSGTNRAKLDVMTERGAAAVASEPGRDSRSFS